jgi:hypothetical protein
MSVLSFRGLATLAASLGIVAFSSAQIPTAGLRLWLRADAGVASTGSLVDSWTDQSGAGHALTQTGSARPLLVTDDSGAALLRFEGTQFLGGDAQFMLQSATIFALFRYRGASSNNYLYSFGRSGGSGSQMTLSRRSPARAYHYDGRNQNIQGEIPTGRWVVSTQLYGVPAIGSHELRIDGATQITSTSSGYSADFSIARIGNWSSGSYMFRGDLVQLIVYGRVLPPAEIATVEAWLAGRVDTARTMTYGQGCPGSAGTPRLQAEAGSLPRPGATFRTETLAVPAGAPVFGLFGFDDTYYRGSLSLPYPLAALGIPQCVLYVSGDVVVPVANPAGRATWSLVIPADPSLLRSCFHLQHVVFDPAANAFGLTVSNALTATIGN